VMSKCLKAIWKLPVESKRLIILVITGRRVDTQSFRREDLIHIAYWEVNLRAVRLQLQRWDREFGEMTGKEGEVSQQWRIVRLEETVV